MAHRFGLPLHLVRVVDANDLPELRQEAGIEPVARELVAAEAMATQYLRCVGRRLGQRGLDVTSEVRHGSAGRQLLTSTRPGDVVVLARRGRGSQPAGLGSVAGKIVARSPVPVVIVAGAEVASAGPRPFGCGAAHTGCSD